MDSGHFSDEMRARLKGMEGRILYQGRVITGVGDLNNHNHCQL